RAKHPASLLMKRAGLNVIGPTRIGQIGGRRASGNRPYRRDQTAVKLKIVVAVEDVVLPVVLVLGHDFRMRQPQTNGLALVAAITFHGFLSPRIGIAAPS